jgi:hypothetical protein
LKFDINYVEIENLLKVNGILDKILKDFVSENQIIIKSLMAELEISK